MRKNECFQGDGGNNVYLDQKQLGPSDYQWLSAPHSDDQVGVLGMRAVRYEEK